MPIAHAALDRPWRRLTWSLPAALLLTGLAMAGFLRLLTGGPPLPSARPVMMQIVELPPAPAPPEALPPTVPEAPPSPPETSPPPVTPLPETAPPVKPPPLPPARKPEPPRRPVRREPVRQHLPERQSAPAAAAPTQPPVPAPATKSPMGVTMGARALYKPMPEIPEALRHRRLSVVALARFHVAADGSATVTLLQATPDPDLNAGLMAALQKWRFFPAMDNGRPVASTIDIRVPIEVR